MRGTTSVPVPLPTEDLTAAYRRAQHRLLLLDYDGTLVPFTERPVEAVPPLSLLAVLQKLAVPHAQRVALVSGRPRAEMERWFGGVNGLWLAAEHGALLREPAGGQWMSLGSARPTVWKAAVRPLLEEAVEVAPGSFVEEKEYSLVWHYRPANRETASARAGPLIGHLEERVAGTGLRVVPGQESVEVRPAAGGKGDVVGFMAASGPADFRLAVGDDLTDEDLFTRLDAADWTVHVGAGPSRARFRVEGPADVRDLLDALARAAGS
jgi:trehalose 6-phosphate synthase/phosphatase